MLTLRTFGGVSLRHDGEVLEGAVVQRRRLALLTVIASAGPSGVSRDKLVGLFWGESDEGRARHALSQWLFLLRQGLPGSGVVAGSTEIRTDRRLLQCDAADFDETIARRDYASALELYVGPFLDGFVLSEAPEFERWVETERTRRHTLATHASEELARRAEASGDDAEAVRWWRRLAALEPLSGRVASELMRALARAGEPAVAIAHAREHTRLLERELGHAAGPEVGELARRLNEAPEAPRIVRPSPTRGPRAESAYIAWLRERFRDRFQIDRVIREAPLLTSVAATDAADGHPLLVRILAPSVVARADLAQLVERLKAAARVSHPRIAWLGDVCREDGLIYTVAPLPEGEPLRLRLDRERHLRLDETLAVAQDVAGALSAGEAASVPHLDLTPRRILLHAGKALVTDLGIMHAVTQAERESATVSSAIRGTPAYMSPEQLAGESAGDHRSDVYALACIVFHALAGEPPHHAKSTRGVVALRLTQPPPKVSQLRDGVPGALDALLVRALARIPADRLASMSEFRDALDALGRDSR